MKQKTWLRVLCILIWSMAGYAQKNTAPNTVNPPKPAGPAKTSCDCASAIKITVKQTGHYGPTLPPNGFGNVQEIKATGPYDKNAFENEHNSAWYLLTVIQDGNLEFDIAPADSSNDYDFLVYPYKDSATCDEILNHKLRPVRSNLSRTNAALKGWTGLSISSQKEFVGKGINDSYSASLVVKKGEQYLLVLDNVYADGKGHRLYFGYKKEVEIKGVVLNEDSVGVKASVSLFDNEGKTVKKVETDNFGKYGFKADMKTNVTYSLTYTNDSGFTQVKTINTSQLKKSAAFNDIRTVLPRLKKGKKYRMGTINFYGNMAKLLPESEPSVEALSKLMKKNKNMQIMIEGYINGAGGGWNDVKLSEQRAETVYDMLVASGIEKERMSKKGFGSQNMLYPLARDESEMAANRRVEIKVISID